MFDEIFGELTFDYGFEKDIKLNLFNGVQSLKLYLLSYNVEEKITQAQKESYLEFESKQDMYTKEVEEVLIKQYGQDFENRFSATTLMIDREGQMAFLLDDKEDLDEGIAVQIIPNLTIYNQSDYL